MAVFGPDGVLLADWSSYYDLVNANLWYLDDCFGTADLQRLLAALQRSAVGRDGEQYHVLAGAVPLRYRR